MSGPPAAIDLGAFALHRWQLEDLSALHEAVADSLEHLRPWMAWAQNADIEAQRSYLQTATEAWSSAHAYEYGLRAPGGEIAGSFGLMARIGPGALEIGYWVHRAYTRRGLAKLGSAALTEAAFGLPGIDRVEIRHDRANVASGAVASGLGFERVAELDVEPQAPADSGIDLHWRIEREAFPASFCPAVLARARGR